MIRLACIATGSALAGLVAGFHWATREINAFNLGLKTDIGGD